MSRPAGLAGRRAAAAACALAAVPLAAVAGCTAAAASKPAAVAPATAGTAPQVSASMTDGQVALSSGPGAAGAPGPAPAALAKFRWSALASSPLGYRNAPLLAWAGGRLLEAGGWAKSGTGRSASAASFDPATGRWQRIADAPAGGSFADGDTSAAWTGRYLAVASGKAAPCPGDPAPARHCWTGLTLYDPAANRWTVLVVPRLFDGLGMAAVVWTGHDLIVGAAGPVNSANAGAGRLALAAYSPTTRRWRTIAPPLPRGHAPGGLYLVYDDERLVLTSLWEDAVQATGGLSQGSWGVDVLTMTAAGTWRNVTRQWPQAIAYGTTATSDGVLDTPGESWCGDLCTGEFTNNDRGYFVNPLSLAARRIPAGPFAALEEGDLDWVWTGDAILTVDTEPNPDGPTGHEILSGDMAMYDPATGRWTVLPATPGHPPLAGSSVWTGTELLNLTEAGALFAFGR